MNADVFRNMDRHGASYWWYRGKQSFIRQIAAREGLTPGGRVLDLGCGTGTLLEFLEGWGSVAGLELSADAIILARQKSGVPVVRGSMEAVPFRTGQFNVVAIFDCLEHLSDDQKAIQEVHRLVSEDGYVLVSVPAFRYLTSWRDFQLKHMRRYTIKDLKTLLESNGFDVRQIVYGYFCLFAPLVLKAAKDRIIPPPKSIRSDIRQLREPWNSLMSKWLSFEAWLTVRTGLPVGTSIFALARRREIVSR